MTRKGFEHRGFPDNDRCRRCLLLVGAIAALLLTMPAASASRGDRLGHAADAVVDAGIPGVVVYVRDKGRTTVVTRGYDDAPNLKRRCGASTIASQGRRVRGVRDRVTSHDS